MRYRVVCDPAVVAKKSNSRRKPIQEDKAGKLFKNKNAPASTSSHEQVRDEVHRGALRPSAGPAHPPGGVSTTIRLFCGNGEAMYFVLVGEDMIWQ